MNGLMNRKLLFVLGPITALLMFGGVVMVVSMLLNREYKEPYRAPAVAADPTPRAGGLAAEKAEAESKARAKPYEEAEYRQVPGRRQPRRDLGGRAAPPPVRGVRPGCADIRVHHRGDRLQDR